MMDGDDLLRGLPSSAYRLAIAPRVLIVSSTPPLAAAIARYLVRKGLSASYTTVKSRAKAYIASARFDLLIVDLPDGRVAWDWAGLEPTHQTPVIVLRPSVQQGSGANQGGIAMSATYLTKPVSGEDIARVAAGLLAAQGLGLLAAPREHIEPNESMPRSAPGNKALSPRETEVLGNMVNGNSNRSIAGIMGLSEPTVKKHVQRIIAKLRAADRTHAAVIAMRAGLVP